VPGIGEKMAGEIEGWVRRERGEEPEWPSDPE
jgi:hypothetical protein